jgi:hypothetical protein
MAIAKIPMRMPSPLKLRLSNCISPVKMNQIDNKSMPRFLVILIDMWKTPFSEKVKGSCKDAWAMYNHKHYPSPRHVNWYFSLLIYMPESLGCQRHWANY